MDYIDKDSNPAVRNAGDPLPYEIIPPQTEIHWTTIGVYTTKHPCVRISGHVYPLHCKGGQDFAEFGSRQQSLILEGAYGAGLAAYVKACIETGYPAPALGQLDARGESVGIQRTTIESAD